MISNFSEKSFQNSKSNEIGNEIDLLYERDPIFKWCFNPS